MDDRRFDDLSRTLATGVSRRKALMGFAASLMGALGYRGTAARAAQAQCGNTSCRNNPGKCAPGCVCCVYGNGNSRCHPPGTCTGTVTCPPGKVADPVRGCVDPCTGPGSCPQPAPSSCQVATCSAGGLCGVGPAGDNAACGAGQACCGGICTTLGTVSNCATCGNACSTNQICSGICTCPNEVCNGACCAVSQVCIGGACSPRAGDGQACDTTGTNDCQDGLNCCGGFCRNLQTNPNFCGTCATNCPTAGPSICQGARTCAAGVCGFNPAPSTTQCRASTGPCDPAEFCSGSSLTCPDDAKTPTGQRGECGTDQVCCGNVCTTLGTLTNCTTCGDVCDPNKICGGGGCTCPNLTCGSACCAAGQVCIGGACRSRAGDGGTCDSGETSDCAAGLVCCGTTCTTLGTTANCSSCGDICPGATPYCVGGNCVACRTPTDCPTAAPGTCRGDRTCSPTGVCGFTAAAAGTVCRAANGGCDLAELCSGGSLDCPTDAVKPANTVCRVAAGDCDVAEVCDGINKACPSDAKAPDNTTCGTDQICCNSVCCAASETCVDNQCQAATCTPGCPRCQSCVDGACQPVATDPRCETLCCDGLCCAPESECVNNICQPICRPLGAACAGAGACCPSEFEDVDCQTVCKSFTTCCHFAGDSCSEDCDCCEGAQCRGEQCCLRPGESCGSDSDCCLQGFEGECRIDGSGDGTCVAFCRGPDAPCTATDECCADEECLDGRCRPPGCLPTGYQCTGAADCCQSEPTVCGTGSGSLSLCCRPDRGQCSATGDCCDDAICSNGSCCRDQGTACNTLSPDSGCCAGLDCIETGPMGQGVCSCRPVGTACSSDLQCCTPPNQALGYCDENRETPTCCVFPTWGMRHDGRLLQLL